ncbi:unnamed protein product [Menidia menidia]|uniref:DNA-directed RNA polymerase I subunit RPA12 n=1 Tax=Menidia menidia TaxID=238744 RepID=A0A8S4AGG8_9TELE|nr:unnamed protein product [Menidia menidia]CAG5866073.1 unnamed protein product [Menidia menidia]
MSCFRGDPNFCPECGNVLPLPGVSDTVRCPRCSFRIPVTEFSGQEVRSVVVFNPAEESQVSLRDEEGSELKGPVIDRRCSRCNKEGMIYHTRQMRSADEGQTVFFTCTHCRWLPLSRGGERRLLKDPPGSRRKAILLRVDMFRGCWLKWMSTSVQPVYGCVGALSGTSTGS